MAVNARFETTSGGLDPGPVRNHPNGPRGNYTGMSLSRSGSFREGVENRMLSSGAVTSRSSGMLMGNLPPVSQCLMLDPIVMGDQKYTRSGELRRVLGVSVGSTLEENSFGAAHSRPSVVVSAEELKHYKESIVDVNSKARGRAKKLHEHLQRLSKYFEALNCKKQQRNKLSTNELSSGLNLKMGTQILRNPQDLVTQKEEDQAKNAVPNKRVECLSNGLARKPLVTAKDCDMRKDSIPSSDLVEEKIRRLPSGGKGWDNKMKRKRSVGTTFKRSVDSEGELKNPMHHKGSNESGLQPCDTLDFRSGYSNGVSGSNKTDSSSFSAISAAHPMPKLEKEKEKEKATLSSDFTTGLNKERLLTKGNNKLNIREGNHIVSHSPLTKGKASRAARSGPGTAIKSSSYSPRVSGAPEHWEQPPSVSKIELIGRANNRKRAMPSGSSSPPMAQWVGQRPHKISRTRRANLVSPVSNHEEMQISSEGCSDFGTRINSSGTNGSHLFRGMANATPQVKVKLENGSSLARFSESEESGASENRLKENIMGRGEVEEKAASAVQNAGPSVFLTKRNKSLLKEEINEGVRKQSRSGRGSSFSPVSISAVREKLETTASTKPFRSSTPGSDKNGSKIGRPLKRPLDRKGFSRRGHILNSGSTDLNGESDDDHEELVAAANFTRDARYHACSSSFWKKMEPFFASVSEKDTSYILQQGELVHEEISASETNGSGEIDRSLQNQLEMKESSRILEFGDEFQDFNALCGKLDTERSLNKVIPIWQRLLSALIIDNEIEEVEENCMGRNLSPEYATNDLFWDAEPRKMGRMEFECEPTFGAQTQKPYAGNIFVHCNGSDTTIRNLVIHNPMQNDELLQVENGFMHSEVGMLAALSNKDIDGQQIGQANGFGISSFDSHYEKISVEDKLLLELQSIGLYLDTVPDLVDRENEVIDQNIFQLKKGVHQQIVKKKACLDEVYKAIQQGKEAEAREVEQAAMDRLVELSYKKLLATRESKQGALAFAKRTLARCLAFEDSGSSCFIEPKLRDIIFAAPSTCDEKIGSVHSSAEQHDLHQGSWDAFEKCTHQSVHAFAKNGPISNRGKRKEVLLDDVGVSAALRSSSTLGRTLLGGAKGKRSERDRGKDVSSRNAVAKAGRLSSSNLKGERKLKSKPKQRTAQLSTSGNEFVNKFTEKTHSMYPSASGSGNLVTKGSNNKKEAISPGTIPEDSSKETMEAIDFTNFPLPDLDSIRELGVGTDLGANEDFFSLLNFDEDGLQDHDLEGGLQIPNDDIALLNMF